MGRNTIPSSLLSVDAKRGLQRSSRERRAGFFIVGARDRVVYARACFTVPRLTCRFDNTKSASARGSPWRIILGVKDGTAPMILSTLARRVAKRTRARHHGSVQKRGQSCEKRDPSPCIKKYVLKIIRHCVPAHRALVHHVALPVRATFSSSLAVRRASITRISTRRRARQRVTDRSLSRGRSVGRYFPCDRLIAIFAGPRSRCIHRCGRPIVPRPSKRSFLRYFSFLSLSLRRAQFSRHGCSP